jgi:hypothetical protein
MFPLSFFASRFHSLMRTIMIIFWVYYQCESIISTNNFFIQIFKKMVEAFTEAKVGVYEISNYKSND